MRKKPEIYIKADSTAYLNGKHIGHLYDQPGHADVVVSDDGDVYEQKDYTFTGHITAYYPV